MNVVSYFDGISCGQIALDKLNIKIDNYFAYEIDKKAIEVTLRNYPSTKQMGDVCSAKLNKLPKIDLLIGGSPCQGFSSIGKQLNFYDKRSKLFFEFVKAKEFLKPKYFFLENVSMKKEWLNIINEKLGVEPIKINSKYFTGQNRPRYYWTNIPFTDYEKKNIPIKFSSELFNKVNPVPFVKRKTSMFKKLPNFFNPYNLSELKNAPTLTSTGNRQTTSASIFYQKNNEFYMANSSYWELLQGIPKDYTKGYSENIRKNLLGNGWTVTVVKHFFQSLS